MNYRAKPQDISCTPKQGTYIKQSLTKDKNKYLLYPCCIFSIECAILLYYSSCFSIDKVERRISFGT